MTFGLLFFAIFAGGWLSGTIFKVLKLPMVIGMTLWGIVLGFLVQGNLPQGFHELEPFIKSFALVVILLRAGLGISRLDLQQAGKTAFLMAIVPCVVEGAVLTLVFHLLFEFSWPIAGLTSFMIAAVSPAVVVPSMLDLKAQGLGTRNGVITVILAGASVDDVFAITFFTMFLGLALGGSSQGGLVDGFGQLATLPLTIIGGIIIGLVVGFALAWALKKGFTKIRATEKALLVLGFAFFMVEVGNWTHVAALLGVMTLGLVLVEKAPPVAQELSHKLAKIWVIAQIALFVVIGLSLDPGVAFTAGPKALLAIAIGLLARSLGVILATIGSAMNLRERLFCIIAYLPKATVQAALGGVALSYGLPEGSTIVAIAVLAIMVTAPLGLLGIRWSAPKLLGDDTLQPSKV